MIIPDNGLNSFRFWQYPYRPDAESRMAREGETQTKSKDWSLTSHNWLLNLLAKFRKQYQ